MGIKNQDLVAQALVEFMERYQHLSNPPITLVLGRELCQREERERTFSKMIKGIRQQVFSGKSKIAPQVRIHDSESLGPLEFVLKTEDGREYAGNGKDHLKKLKMQLEKTMLEGVGL